MSVLSSVITKSIAIAAIGAGAVAIVGCRGLLGVDDKYIADGGNSTGGDGSGPDAGAGGGAGDGIADGGNSTGGDGSGPDAGAPPDKCDSNPPKGMKRLTLTAKFQERPSTKTTVNVSLRRGPYTPVATATGTLNSLDIVCLDFGTVQTGENYYIVVNSASSLETWSATGQSFVNGALSYDFTTGVDKAYGGNMHLNTATGKAEIYEGDVNQDGVFEVMDQKAVYDDMHGRSTGWPTDVNGDGVVNQTDLDIVYANIANSVELARPY
jgi:hypothetical protein